MYITDLMIRIVLRFLSPAAFAVSSFEDYALYSRASVRRVVDTSSCIGIQRSLTCVQ